MDQRKVFGCDSRRCASAATLAAMAWAVMLPAIAADQPASEAEVASALKVLERWQGRWQVTTTTTRPKPSTVTSVTTSSWVLGNRFLQNDSGTKSDGSHDLSLMTFDAVTRAYPLWIFTSSGVVFYLAEGRWNERERTMTWDSPFNLSSSYRYRCSFSDDDHYRCRSQVKDWKGSLLLELESVGVRAR